MEATASEPHIPASTQEISVGGLYPRRGETAHVLSPLKLWEGIGEMKSGWAGVCGGGFEP